MKKITWNEVLEKGRNIWEEHRDVCLVARGVVIGVTGKILLEEVHKKVHAPKEVEFVWKILDDTKLKIECFNIDKMGHKTYATGFSLKPAQAIHMARSILYHLAGEAE